MKRYLLLVVAFVVVFSVMPRVYADGPVDKLGRGLVNILMSPAELFHPSEELRKPDDNIGSRFGNFLYRAGIGIVEVATFPIPIPEDYGPIIDREGYVMTAHYKEQSKEQVDKDKAELLEKEKIKTATF
jgi:hypothetical protein